MAFLSGEKAQKADIDTWYNNLNNIIKNFGGSISQLTTLTNDKKIAADDINNYFKKMDEMKQDNYLGSDQSIYPIYSLIENGSKIITQTAQIADSATNSTYLGQVKCRNNATNTNTQKSHSTHQNVPLVHGANNHQAYAHGDLTHGTKTHGAHTNGAYSNGCSQSWISRSHGFKSHQSGKFRNGTCSWGGYSESTNTHSSYSHGDLAHGLHTNSTFQNTNKTNGTFSHLYNSHGAKSNEKHSHGSTIDIKNVNTAIDK